MAHIAAVPIAERRAGQVLRRTLLRALENARVLGGLLVVGFLLLQLVYLKPPSPLDPMVYFEAAAGFPDIALEHREMRYGVVLPVALLTELLGYSSSAYYALPLLSGGMLVGGAFLLGYTLFGRGVGALSAILVGVNGYVLDESSLLMPDLLAAGLFTLGMALLLHVAQRVGAPGSSRAIARDEIVLLAASGVEQVGGRDPRALPRDPFPARGGARHARIARRLGHRGSHHP